MGALTVTGDPFPFGRELSLKPLVAFWQRDVPEDRPVQRAIAAQVLEGLARAPELTQPITDLSVLERHRDLVDVLMGAVFPPGGWERQYGAAMFPFSFRSVYATPSFTRDFTGPDGTLTGKAGADPMRIMRFRSLYAYAHVLRALYGLDPRIDLPLIFTFIDAATGLERHFQMVPDTRFLEVQPLRPLPPLSAEDRQTVLARFQDPDALRTILPPEWFRFSGFVVFRAIEVTTTVVVSALERDLIERESITAADRFVGLQDRLRTLFRRPDLTFSVAAIEGERVLLLNSGSKIEHGCILADSSHYNMKDFEGSVYARAVQEGQPVVVEDLAQQADRTELEDHFLEMGERSTIVAPLNYEGETIGVVRLGVTEPGAFTSLSALTLTEILPLFAMGVRRSLDELESRLQAMMKERYTAIHPSVEWRFRQAVLEVMESQRGDGAADVAPIVFPDVHPLYAMTDIRGSSVQRNLAIQSDLAEHLRLAHDVVGRAHAVEGLPILDELIYRIEKHARRVDRGLGSGDDVLVLEFLRGQVGPILDHVRALSPEILEAVEAYEASLDPAFHTVYRRRRDFEQSVTLINETIAGYLDEQEAVAQRVLPHYFEKQSTDGVDYNIFAGASIMEGGRFDPLHLRNLRLWQLLVTCGVARRVEPIKARLSLPLEVTHLILVHGSPLSVRFRPDEKRFDVDGAYNMRYEIVKKRIDKAYVKGTGQRLTQPGMIAIVFSQPADIPEYRDYLEYLQARGLVQSAVEELELEDLQGVKGLRALRVPIALGEAPAEPRVLIEELAAR